MLEIATIPGLLLPCSPSRPHPTFSSSASPLPSLDASLILSPASTLLLCSSSLTRSENPLNRVSRFSGMSPWLLGRFRAGISTNKMDASISWHGRGISSELSDKHHQPMIFNAKYRALFVDAGGTLLQPARPIEETYSAYGLKYGVKVALKDIKEGFRRAFAKPWPERLRYEGDGKLFWRYAVEEATSCNNEDYFEELYNHYAKAAAWKLPDDALCALNLLRNSGVKLGVLSNFDSRLRPILEDLNIAHLFHSIIVSCEIGYEKPSPEIFNIALRELNLQPNEAVLIGDDPINDKEGAEAVGINAWLWKKEVTTFKEVANRVLGAQCLT